MTSTLFHSSYTGINNNVERTYPRRLTEENNVDLIDNVPFNLTSSSRRPNEDILQEHYGISQSTPKYKQYAVKHVREASYVNFPSHVTQTPNELAEAGFFYSGKEDVVFCYHCGQGLKSWDPDDNVWVEHARWAPHCVHVLNCKGREFVMSVQEEKEDTKQDESHAENSSSSNSNNFGLKQSKTKSHKKNDLNSLLQTIAAESLILNGYSKELVGKSIRIFLVKEGRENFNSTDLMKILLQLEDGEIQFEDFVTETETLDKDPDEKLTGDQQVEAKSLIEENRQLKEQTLCKICLDESVSMVFLPCGHLCCCSQCAPALRKCPICRVFIRGTVKTYLN